MIEKKLFLASSAELSEDSRSLDGLERIPAMRVKIFPGSAGQVMVAVGTMPSAMESRIAAYRWSTGYEAPAS
jgi:hypothetical protein